MRRISARWRRRSARVNPPGGPGSLPLPGGVVLRRNRERSAALHQVGGQCGAADSAESRPISIPRRVQRKLIAYIWPTVCGSQSQREGNSMYEDKTLVCKECGKEFVFSAGEQEFYAERGFQNEPQRCKACRDARKAAARGPREYFTAVCAACGGEARVPFEPKSDRPVYCSECFARMRRKISFKSISVPGGRTCRAFLQFKRQILLYKYLRYLRGKP